MSSSLFSSDSRRAIEGGVVAALLTEHGFLSETTARSPRAVGDAIQDRVAQRWLEVLPEALDLRLELSRKDPGDLRFRDQDGFQHIVDVKTHRDATQFNMPNLTSVSGIDRLYRDRRTYFDILLVRYSIDGAAMTIGRVDFVPIEWISWDCLTLGALGLGQIQLKNANRFEVIPSQTRTEWMGELMRRLTSEFYPKQITKMERLLKRFDESRRFWESVGGDGEPST